MRDVIAVFAKAPVPGRVKTRLVPHLTPGEAAAVHEASLRDVVDRIGAATADVRLIHDAADGSGDWMRAEFPDIALATQSDGSLGDRMAAAFGEIFDGGAERVAIVGSDSPTLPAGRYRAALDALATCDVALGPAEDGGYYLVATRRTAWPRASTIFRGIAWSTDRVLRQTVDAARREGLLTTLLEPWYDIDRPEDLLVARADADTTSHLGRLLEKLPIRTDRA